MFLVPPCCVHRDRRPDQNSKWRPFSTFCFPFLKVLLFCSCLFVRQVHGLPLPQVTPPSAAPSSPPSAALPSPPAVNVASPPLTQARRPAADSSSLVLARSVVLSLVVLKGTVLIRLLRDPVRAPDSLSCPEEASASKLAQEGFLFLFV